MEEREKVESTFELLPEGEYLLTYLGRSDKMQSGKSHYRTWTFSFLKDGQIKKVSFRLYPWEAESVTLALGGRYEKEEDGTKVLVFDSDLAVDEGIEIDGEIFHTEYNGKKYMKLRCKTEDVPF